MSKLIIKLITAFRKSRTYPAALGKSTDTSECQFSYLQKKNKSCLTKSQFPPMHLWGEISKYEKIDANTQLYN